MESVSTSVVCRLLVLQLQVCRIHGHHRRHLPVELGNHHLHLGILQDPRGRRIGGPKMTNGRTTKSGKSADYSNQDSGSA